MPTSTIMSTGTVDIGIKDLVSQVTVGAFSIFHYVLNLYFTSPARNRADLLKAQRDTDSGVCGA